MSNKAISQLDSATTPLSGSELFALVQNNITKKVSLNQLSSFLGSSSGGGEVIATNYSNLLNLYLNGQMEPGAKYVMKINTKHIIPGTSEVHTGDDEYILLEATSADTLASRVFSLQNPLDIIEYDITDRFLENNLSPSTPDRDGRIIYRKDIVKNLSTYYDFRNVVFKRYSVDTTSLSINNDYLGSAFYKDYSNLYYSGVVYLAARTGNTTGYTTSDWKRVISTSGSLWKSSLVINSYLTLSGVSGVNIKTFDSNCENISVGKAQGTNYNNITFVNVQNTAIADGSKDGIINNSSNISVGENSSDIYITSSNELTLGEKTNRTFISSSVTVNVGSNASLSFADNAENTTVGGEGTMNFIAYSKNIEIKTGSAGNYLMRTFQIQIGRNAFDNSLVGIAEPNGYYPTTISNGVLRDSCVQINLFNAGDYSTIRDFEFEEGCAGITYTGKGSRNIRVGKACRYFNIYGSMINVEFGAGCTEITLLAGYSLTDVVFGPGLTSQGFDANFYSSNFKQVISENSGAFDDLIGRSQVIMENPHQLEKQIPYITKNGALEAISMYDIQHATSFSTNEYTSVDLDINGHQLKVFSVHNTFVTTPFDFTLNLLNPHADFARVIINVVKLMSATDRNVTIAGHTFVIDGPVDTLHRFEAIYSHDGIGSMGWTVVDFNAEVQGALGYTPENVANKNAANGYAGLDSNSKINPSQLPAIAITDTFVVASQSAMLALTAETGDIAIRSDQSKTYILKGSNPATLGDWELLQTPTDVVSSVFGRTGAVTAQSGDYTFSQIGSTPTTLAGYGITDAVDGSGATDRVARWSDSNTVAAGVIRDNGSTASINTTPDSGTVLKIVSAVGVGLNVANTAGGTSNIYSIVGGATGTNTGSNVGVYGNALNSSGGTNLGVRGSANSQPVQFSQNVLFPGANAGGFFQGHVNSGIAYGVVGSADADSSQSATFIGGLFRADNATTKHAVQLIDGTEGTGKFLKSVSSDGKANWANIEGTNIKSTSETTGKVLTTDGSGNASWQTPTSSSVTLKQVYEFSLLGAATGGVPGEFGKAIGTGNLPTTSSNTIGIANGYNDPYRVAEASTVTKIGITLAHAAVNFGTVGSAVKIRLELFKVNYSTRTSLATYDISLSNTNIGTWDSLNLNAFQSAELTGLSTALSAGDLIGIQFTNLSANNNQIDALDQAFVTLVTTIN